MQMLGGRQDMGGSSHGDDGGYEGSQSSRPAQAAPAPRQQAAPPPRPAPKPVQSFSDMDDDIPF
jgi:single-strand DNA-binding protein